MRERDELEEGENPEELAFGDGASEAALRQLDALYPLWKRTDWTPTQRTLALRGLLLLALGGGLIAGCLAVWLTASFAATLLAPIGLTLLCLGVTHLNMAFWYAFRHGVTTQGERLRKVLVMTGVTRMELVIDLVTLGLQLVGVSVTAALTTFGPADGWHGVDPFVLAYLMLAPMGMGFAANAAAFAAVGASISWRPRRDPAEPSTVLARPARGLRWLLRWVVVGMHASGAALVLVSPLALFDSYLALSVGSPDPLLPKKAALFGLGAALGLLLALGELTNRERATPTPPATPEAA